MLELCNDPDDYMRKEIELAMERGATFLTINPDYSFDGIQDDVPENIVQVIKGAQMSYINFNDGFRSDVNSFIRFGLSPHAGYRGWTLAIIYIVIILMSGVAALARVFRH